MNDSIKTNSIKSADRSIKIVKTKENTRILGYRCLKYLVYETLNERTLTHTFWMTKGIKNISMSGLSKARVDILNQCLFYDLGRGVPLRAEITSSDGNTMTINAIEIKKEVIDISNFSIPADYVRKN